MPFSVSQPQTGRQSVAQGASGPAGNSQAAIATALLWASSILYNIFMATSVHIPDKLLKEADKRAMALGISRNRLIVRALERELQERSDWSPGFFDTLRSIEHDTAGAVDELISAVKAGRRSKPPQRF